MEMEPGGNKGGETLFVWGLGLFLLGFGAYLFLDSVRIVAGNEGVLSGMLRGRGGRGGGMGGTLSNTLIFTPFFLGIAVLFYDYTRTWAKYLTGVGVIFIIVEVLSRTRFHMDIKVSHLLILLLMMAAGTGLILRSYAKIKSASADNISSPSDEKK